MEDSSGSGGALDNSATIEITGKIMVIAIIVLFLVVVFVLFLHLYAKWFWWRIEQPPTEPPVPHHSHRQRRRFVFAPGQDPLSQGLDPAVLRSLPVLQFSPQYFKEGLECAVCLSELVQGEKARLLPKCNHGFHVDCIDMWFQSHSTCPLCRNLVTPDLECSSVSASLVSSDHDLQSSVSEYSSESPNFPTNVLFWGNQTLVNTGVASSQSQSQSQSQSHLPPLGSELSSSSSSANIRHEGVLIIDIPATVSDGLSASSPTSFENEQSKSPMPTRLRSLKRLLSRDKKAAPSSSGASVDIEKSGPDRFQE